MQMKKQQAQQAQKDGKDAKSSSSSSQLEAKSSSVAASVASSERLAFVQNKMQRGDRNPWHVLHAAAEKYYATTDSNVQTWEAMVEYNKPGDGGLMVTINQ
jgi:hypothetical protein